MKKFLIFLICSTFMIMLNAQNFNMPVSPKEVPSPYQPEVLKGFADSLYDDGFLSQAESEYKRLLFALPQTDPEDSSKIEEAYENTTMQESLSALTNIYKKQQNVSGIEWLSENFYYTSNLFVKEKMNYVQAEFIFKSRNAENFSLFTAKIEKDKQSFSPDFSNLIDVSSLILDNDIKGLKNLCSNLVTINPDYEKLNELCQSYKLKKAGLALFFSMVIPGSGKWYTGSFGAFVSSFITIGSFVAGTVVTGIQTEWKSWQPYVFGTVGVVLYIAELYGAYQSAKRYNAALYRTLCEETEKIYEKEY